MSIKEFKEMLNKTIGNIDIMIQQHEDKLVTEEIVCYKKEIGMGKHEKGEEIGRYRNIREAAAVLGMAPVTIHKFLVGEKFTAMGYAFEKFHTVEEADSDFTEYFESEVQIG